MTAAAASTARPALSPEQKLRLFGQMLRIRLLDERMMTLQRQGRIGFYGACTGQEGAVIGSASALDASDWIFPALREGAAMLLRGFPLTTYIAQVFGNAGDITKARQMPSHQAAKSVNQVSWSSCIGTQLPQAVGAAHAARLRGERTVVAAYLGDGATSSADFHVAMNFAGVWKAPVVFICQNNQWAISIPVGRQTAAQTLAAKAQGYGMGGVRIDGNDALAVFATVREAVDRARAGGGPTFVECLTYRIGAHSSSDDPTRYRDEREVEVWRGRDPIDRLRALLVSEGLLDERREQALREDLGREIADALAAVEPLGPPHWRTLFEDVYGSSPWNLREQEAQLQAEKGA